MLSAARDATGKRYDESSSQPGPPKEPTPLERSLETLTSGTEIVRLKKRGKNRSRFQLTTDSDVLTYASSWGCFPSQWKKVEVCQLREVRSGYGTDVFNKQEKKPDFVNKYPPDRCFAVVTKSGKVMNLIAEDKKQRDDWVDGLGHLVTESLGAQRGFKTFRWLWDLFQSSDTNGDGCVDLDEAVKLLRELNITASKQQARVLFTKSEPVDRNGTLVLDVKGFDRFFQLISKRPEIAKIFENPDLFAFIDPFVNMFSKGRKQNRANKDTACPVKGGLKPRFNMDFAHVGDRIKNGGVYLKSPDAETWEADDLLRFFQLEQKDSSVTLDGCREMISLHERLPENKKKQVLSMTGFTAMVSNNTHFEGFKAECRAIYHDMTRPITDYFIAASHNSYLTDRCQFVGASSIEGYVSCILAGACCLELDCWDGDDGDPVVTHGHTLVSAIQFSDVLEVVRDHGFTKAQTPIILSLENHCSLPQQNRIAHHLRTILGDRLFVGEITSSQKACPSPLELIGKVLVKNKKLPPKINHDAEVHLSDEDEPVKDGHGQGGGTGRKEKTHVTTMGDQGEPEKPLKPKEEVMVSKVLSDCVYLRATKFPGSFAEHKNGKFFEISSVSESQIEKMLERDHTEIIEHCQRQLVRIYPKGVRVFSANFNPIPLFDSGCQLIAMNYQDDTWATQVYRAKFRDNGGCGYLLKPEYMRTPGLDVVAWERNREPMVLKLRVISGQQLPKPVGDAKWADVVDPYVRVEIHGTHGDEAQQKTHTIQNNGWNPVWDKEFVFKLNNPEMTILRLVVKDEDVGKHPTIGQHTVSLTCLPEGYRTLSLYTKKDLPVEQATLFIHVTKEMP